jgi:DNA-damage-inducible protein J
MSKNAVIHTRINADLKAGAEQILESVGISASEAIRLFYRQIKLHRGIPFDVKLPNKQTAETLRRSERGEEVYRAADADDLFDQLGL